MEILGAENTTMSTTGSRRATIQKRSDLCVKTCRYLYRNVHGRLLSIKYRKEVADMSDQSLTFGEIVPQSFLQILNYTSDSTKVSGRNFVDLGSGTGRACICAALSPYGFSEVLGIELMPDLCTQAESVHVRLLELLEKPVSDSIVAASKVKGSEKSIPSADLDSVALQVFSVNPSMDQGMPVDLFANLITKQMGHKAFKVAVKQHKTFAKYLKEKASLFTLSEDGKHVNVRVAEAKTEPTKEETTEQVQRSTCTMEEGASVPHTAMQDAASSTTAITIEDDYPFQLTVSDVRLLSPFPRIQIHNGDMFAYDWWKDADVVYAASLLFSEAMMQTLTIQVSWMKPGAWMVSLKPLLLELNADQLKSSVVLRSESFYKMSWQMAKVYIYQVV